MSPLVVRRISFVAGLVVLSGLTLFCWSVLETALRPAAIYSGALLLFVVLVPSEEVPRR